MEDCGKDGTFSLPQSSILDPQSSFPGRLVRNRRLVWQIFPTVLIIALTALFAAGWAVARSFEAFYLDRIDDELGVRNELVSRDGAPLLSANTPQSLSDLRERVKYFGEKTATRYTVMLPDGKVVADTDHKPENMENHAARDEMAAALASGKGVASHYSTTTNQRMRYVAQVIKHNGQTVGVVRSAIKITQIDEEIASVRNRFIAWGFFVALCTAGVSWLMARRITRPIEDMRRGAESYARGELDYQLPLPESYELAGLATALNSMAAQLEDRIQTILRQSSEQNAVLASMAEGVLAVDPRERIITLNSAAADLLECNRERALGRSVQDFVLHPELRKFVSQAVTCDEPIQQDITLEAGFPRIIQARGTALGDRGQRRGAVIVLNDVTNVRRLENLRRDFVANVSHELKTPITSIKGFVETLLDGAIEDRADAERFLGIVGKQADRLAAIVDDLLSLAKIEQTEDTELDVHEADVTEVIQAAIVSCQALAKERQVNVRFDANGSVMAEISPHLMEQAVVNLLDNAIKYSGAESEVVLATNITPTEVLISVVDRGVGVEAEHIPRLFERFYRVDKARSRKLGGTGLGLAIVKHIVSAHRGRVAVESRPGVGSTFTIHLPKPNIR
jgi:two-component system, OmpR family, phosphate regulon sensor histidine kinase PhoR